MEGKTQSIAMSSSFCFFVVGVCWMSSSGKAFMDTLTRSGRSPIGRTRSKTVSMSQSIKLEPQPGPLLFRLSPVTEGYLLFKKKRRYVILDCDSLFLFKNTQDFKEPPTKIPLHLSAVRPTHTKDVAGFDIITSGETFPFQLDKEALQPGIAHWVQKIQEVCDKLVLNQIGGCRDNILKKTYSKLISRDDIEGVINDAEGEHDFSIYQKKAIKIAMREGNRVCADCRAPEPEWASTNLGMFICIDCSGVHRSFGSHISKVRSVKLDNWEAECLEQIDTVGNNKGNEFWEYNVPSEFARPETFILSARKHWLTMKYIEKRFTKDYRPRRPRRNSKLELQNQQLQQIKNEAANIRKGEYKSTILRLLREDPDFLQEMRVLLLQDVDLDQLRQQIEEVKANAIPVPRAVPSVTFEGDGYDIEQETCAAETKKEEVAIAHFCD